MVERSDDEVDEVLAVGQATLEEPHDDHVMGQSHRVGVEPGTVASTEFRSPLDSFLTHA